MPLETHPKKSILKTTQQSTERMGTDTTRSTTAMSKQPTLRRHVTTIAQRPATQVDAGASRGGALTAAQHKLAGTSRKDATTLTSHQLSPHKDANKSRYGALKVTSTNSTSRTDARTTRGSTTTPVSQHPTSGSVATTVASNHPTSRTNVGTSRTVTATRVGNAPPKITVTASTNPANHTPNVRFGSLLEMPSSVRTMVSGLTGTSAGGLASSTRGIQMDLPSIASNRLGPSTSLHPPSNVHTYHTSTAMPPFSGTSFGFGSTCGKGSLMPTNQPPFNDNDSVEVEGKYFYVKVKGGIKKRD